MKGNLSRTGVRYAPGTNHDLYDLPAIPSLYLLDTQKHVMVKDGTFEEIEERLTEVE